MSAAPFSAVYFEGRFLQPPFAEARVSVTDPGYLLGEGVFATMRGYDGVCFRAERHLSKLRRGAEAFGIQLPAGTDRIIAIADEAASRTRERDAYVRVTLTRASDEAHPVLTVISRPLDMPSPDDYLRGVSATVVTMRRIPPACFDPTMKSTSYAPQVLARREVASRGAAEGIVLAVDGTLACGTMGNLFLVDGDRLRTPSLASGCREGVTREAVIEVAAGLGMELVEEHIEPVALFEVEEAFFSSTRVECLPIGSVDGRAVGGRAASGDELHPRTTKLRKALREMVSLETTYATLSERRSTS